MRILIAEDGQAYPIEQRSLGSLFGSFETTRDLITHALRNCGAALLFNRQGHYRIYARPGFLSCAAFEKLVCYLAISPPLPIVIVPALQQAFLGDIFADMSDLSDAVARLDQYRRNPRLSLGGTRFLSSPWSPSQLLTDHRRPEMRAAYLAWRASAGRFSRRRLARMLKDPLAAEGLLTRQGADGMPITEAVSAEARFWRPIDPEALIGRPMEVYAPNAAEGFSAVSRTEAPLLETIDSFVMTHEGSVSILRYDRLLLPWRGTNNERFVTCASFMRVERRFPLTSLVLSGADELAM